MSDFASARAERYASGFAADILDKTIESVSKKDGRIFVDSFLSEKAIAEMAEEGLIVGFSWDDAFEDKVELCFDADCTESYNPYVNIDSDITIYVKRAE